MKKIYEAPKAEIISLSDAEIIVTSGICAGTETEDFE